MSNLYVVEKLIIDLRNNDDIDSPEYKDLEFTLRNMLPKGVIVNNLKTLPYDKLNGLLTKEIRSNYNQLELAVFLLNEYVDYNIVERSKILVKLLKMISLSEIDSIDFLQYILHNKHVIKNTPATRSCYVFISNIFANNTKKSEKEEIKKIVLDFKAFKNVLEASKKRYLDVGNKYTIKKIQGTVLDTVMIESLYNKYIIKGNALKRSKKIAVPCIEVNKEIDEKFNISKGEVPIEVVLRKKIKLKNVV
uniref:CSN8_PSD8_EIF3K domain-containing protein n=1 Tax=Strongyloides papillosus TaxID=174720 RepID=A0A0N5B5W3_STREA